jgi:putative transposon-encoded protein
MVVPIKPLMISPADFEVWMEKFAEYIGNSAGVVCFSEYFGDQMLSSMMRLDSSKKITSNFPCHYHKDFSMLYKTLSMKHQQEERVRNVTGCAYTPESFVNCVLAYRRLMKRAEDSQQEAAMLRAKCISLEAELKAAKQDDACNTVPTTRDPLPRPSLTDIPMAESSRSQLWHRMIDDFEDAWPVRVMQNIASDAQVQANEPSRLLSFPVSFPAVETIIWTRQETE